MFNNIFDGIIGKTQPDQFRLSIDGKIAVKGAKGDYRTFDLEKNKLVSVGEFAMPNFSDTFFTIPTRKLEKGDIVVLDGEPVCVIEQDDNTIKALSYSTSKIETRMVENIIWFGKPFYGKVASMFSMAMGNTDNEASLMKIMMVSQLMGGTLGQQQQAGGTDALMLMMLLGGSGNDLFGGLFK